jgi:hypothetical protein
MLRLMWVLGLAGCSLFGTERAHRAPNRSVLRGRHIGISTDGPLQVRCTYAARALTVGQDRDLQTR